MRENTLIRSHATFELLLVSGFAYNKEKVVIVAHCLVENISMPAGHQ